MEEQFEIHVNMEDVSKLAELDPQVRERLQHIALVRMHKDLMARHEAVKIALSDAIQVPEYEQAEE